MSLRVVEDGSTRSSRNPLYDCRSSRSTIAFHWTWAETNSSRRQRFHVSWWNREISKSLSASLDRFVCHLGDYGMTWMSNMIWICEFPIVIPRLPCLFRMATAVSSTIKLLNSGTSDSVNSFNFAMWAFATKCYPIELVPCSNGWQELDDKQYIWCQCCRCPQFRSVNRIARNPHV